MRYSPQHLVAGGLFYVLRGLISAFVLLLWASTAAAQGQTGTADADLINQGAYIFRAGGCYECHTDTKNKGAPLAGGRALPTPFGIFYSPNITPDPETGIGRWTEAQFIAAVRQGLAPDGTPYYPAFPYTSFTQIKDDDLHALWVYLRAQPAVRQANKPHGLGFPFNLRMLMWGWRLIYFHPGRFAPDATQSPQWNRGAYLANALGHCGECHTPRDQLGGLKGDMIYAGSNDGAEGKPVPNITPHPKNGIGSWSETDIADFLGSGMTPEGDFAGGLMADVIDDSSKYLTADDRLAIAVYLKSLPPVDFRPQAKGQQKK